MDTLQPSTGGLKLFFDQTILFPDLGPLIGALILMEYVPFVFQGHTWPLRELHLSLHAPDVRPDFFRLTKDLHIVCCALKESTLYQKARATAQSVGQEHFLLVQTLPTF